MNIKKSAILLKGEWNPKIICNLQRKVVWMQREGGKNCVCFGFKGAFIPKSKKKKKREALGAPVATPEKPNQSAARIGIIPICFNVCKYS